jgi:hypothetical protein
MVSKIPRGKFSVIIIVIARHGGSWIFGKIREKLSGFLVGDRF